MLSMPECLWGNGAVCTSGVSGWARKIGGVVGGNDSMILGIIQMMSFVWGQALAWLPNLRPLHELSSCH
ncbi:hypothetical protein CU666_22940 [Pseudomonas syringae pv. actinidifoliorum]|nr:hypothetical protein [Pseudomonas syringae pv. theae]MBL3868270.1 hypothetical protein [Pseudomonas syringae pv. theae]NAT60673.1 hypothetical protein [Pseudomonas syringae pv. actinidifoliorum]